LASYSRVILIGNITRDIQLRHTPGGMAVADVGLAVNEKRKGQDGEMIEEVTFVDITLWGKTAEVASQYCQKGSPLFVEGRLKLESWEKDGVKHNKLKVVGEKIQLLGSRSEGGERQQQPRQQSRPSGSYNVPVDSNIGGDSDIPF